MYLINRTPSGLLNNKTPYEILFGKAPSFDEMRVFGCLCFAHNQRAKGNKFAPRSRKCVFVGYPNGKKGWKLYDLETGEIFVSRDVKFHEGEFPFAEEQCTSSADSDPTLESAVIADTDEDFLEDLATVLDADSPIVPPDTVVNDIVDDAREAGSASRDASPTEPQVVAAPLVEEVLPPAPSLASDQTTSLDIPPDLGHGL